MGIRPTDLSEKPVRELLELHHQEMIAFSPPGTAHVLDMSALLAPDIEVFAGWEGDALMAIGAIRKHSDFAEIKSMRAHPDARGKGYGRIMLHHLLDRSRDLGFELVRLETGTGELFEAANGLYLANGFKRRGPFAGYVDTEFNLFYERAINEG